MKRRDFLKLTGFAGSAALSGCTRESGRLLIPFLNPPENIVPGRSTWFATACRQCPAGCGLLAKNREARIVKLEGNPSHPINRGKLCARGQAGLQGLYSPDRLQAPVSRQGGRDVGTGWDEALQRLRREAVEAGGRIALISGLEEGFHGDLLSGWLAAHAPGQEILYYEPVSYEDVREGNRLAFGEDRVPAYDISACDFLLSIGADFLDTWISPVEFARQFAEARDPAGRNAGFVYAGPRRSVTAANADRWIPLSPEGGEDLAFAVLASLVRKGAARNVPDSGFGEIRRLLAGMDPDDLARSAGVDPGLVGNLARRIAVSDMPFVLAGGGPRTVLAANLINLLAGSAGSCMDFRRPLVYSKACRASRMQETMERMAAGEFRMLLVHRANPVYSLPGFEEALRRVPFVAVLEPAPTETTACAHLVLPVPSSYECWGFFVPREGLVNTMQPAMGPITGARSLEEILGPADSEEGVQGLDPAVPSTLCGLLGYSPNEDPGKVVRLFAEGFRERPPGPALRTASLKLRELPPRPAAEQDGLALFVYPSLRWYDGRDADKDWMLEIPDPITRITWDTWLEIHPDRAEQEGIEEGDLVEIAVGQARVRVGAHLNDGLHPETVAMPMGLGHGHFGRTATGVGVNPLPLTGGRDRIRGVSVRKTGLRALFARVDGSPSQHGREIARAVVEDAAARPRQPELHPVPEYPLRLPVASAYDPGLDLYPPHEHDRYRWGMVVDLDRCTGCAACVAACYAENNVASVGRKRILEGREMAWLRIDRYLEPGENPGVRFLPMMCQHCDNAPCESVCPVYAPHHDSEGLNTQIYNRCIGTRYCSQNCPYKVRRFNFFLYGADKPLNMQFNPDVSVRTVGVMEKCSFCVQRIKEAHQAARDENRPIRDGDVTPACGQTCPAGAITFGSFLDPESRILKQAGGTRAYQVLGELNTKPGVIYLKKIIRKDPLKPA